MALPEHVLPFLRAFQEATVFVTPRGAVLGANRRARALLDIHAERPADCELSRLVTDPVDRLADTLRFWSRSTDPIPGSFTLAANGTPTTCNARGSLVVPAVDGQPAILMVRFWPRGEANPFVLLNQKVTELNDEMVRRVQVEDALRRSEAALHERVREAEALNRAKDEFLATVSHELRTPLSAILGWAWLLRRRVVDEETSKGLDVIHRNAEAQAKLVDDILDVSRIITGKMLIEVRPTDLAALVDEAVEVVRPSAAAKHIAIDVDRPVRDLPLVGDPDRIRQAVWNVLSNAVKFTGRDGTIRVAVGQQGSQFCVTVADTGAGIDPAFLPFVFDRFRQADSSTTRRSGGLGLGLALVRSIVELHGGAVSAASKGLGKGATFTIVLPVRAVDTSAAATPASETTAAETGVAAPGALRGVRTLVVDDEADARDMLSTLLSEAGSEVATAGSVAAAFEVLARFRPHVLVSDIGMPDENGYSLMQRLRQLGPDAGGDIPAVALTAYTRPEDRQQALAAGFTTHIGKPVRPDDLVSAVAGLAAARAD